MKEELDRPEQYDVVQGRSTIEAVQDYISNKGLFPGYQSCAHFCGIWSLISTSYRMPTWLSIWTTSQ